MEYYVYYLFVEGDGLPFYVGKSFVGSNRLNEHKSHSKEGTNRKARKIQKALREGKRIIEKVIATVGTEPEAHELENALIKLHGRLDTETGFLTNHTDGGEGPVGMLHTEAAKAKMSEAKKGNKINVGRKRPDMVEMFSKEITAFDESGTPVQHFSSAREAEKELYVDYKSISDILRGRNGYRFTKSKMTGVKYHFRYGHITEKIELPGFRCKSKEADRPNLLPT